MPLKIGKSKSSSGSELIHTNSCPDDSAAHTKKNRGLRRLFDRGKCSSSSTKISSNENSSTKSPQYNKLSECGSNLTPSDSSHKNQQQITCHSVSPKLYTNSCASSIEELSKVALNPNGLNTGVSSSAIPCSPIQDVILEEDYEEALLLTNKTQSARSTDSDSASKEAVTQPSVVSSVKFSQGIYNEPKDTAKGLNKEIIETCRLSQITPTNQFKEIRSRSGSDTDPLIVHPDLGVGGRCSTNSSSIGSALTLSESPAVVPQSCSPQSQSVNMQSLPTVPTAVPPTTIALSINVHTSLQTSSGPPTVYTNSPKGNTVICHHPSSPFAPPTSVKPNSSSNPPSCVGSATAHSPSDRLSASPKVVLESPDRKSTDSAKNALASASIISRRPERFGKASSSDASQVPAKQPSEFSASQEAQQYSRNSDRRSEYYSKHPVYEEAWDLKLRRICKDMAEQSGKSSQHGVERLQDSYSAVNSGLPSVPSSIINSFHRPQSAAGARRRTDSPSSKYASPPAVPPHRRNSVHYKLTHGLSFEDPKLFNEQLNANSQTSQSINDCRTAASFSVDESITRVHPLKPNLKHTINPSFDDQGLTTDYDYAYNETWSLGVQFNMAFNLTNNDSNTNVSSSAKKDSFTTTNSLTAGYMDKIDSVDSEESSSLSTSQEVPNELSKEKSQNATEEKKSNIVEDELMFITNATSVDNDSLSNDSYEEPWDVRHGRVISELTSARLIDPACVLSVHDPQLLTPSSRAGVPSPPSHHKINAFNHSRNVNRHQNESKSHNSNSSSSNHSKRQRSVSASRRIAALSSIPSNSIINKSISLEEQLWYHEDCTRQQAEQLLTSAKEGSFLVRKSETSRNDFSLTIKHNNDFLHMKISKNQRGFILGQYSQPYVSIPHMLHHYSLTMVPVKGADAVLLKIPITR